MPRLETRKLKRVSTIDIGERPITIGRASSNDLTLPNTHVSRNHCVIESVNGSVRIRDLGSHGGTFVNGSPITQAALAHGDRVSVGPFDLLFHDPVSANAATLRGTTPPPLAEPATPLHPEPGLPAPPPSQAEIESLRQQLEAEQVVRLADANRISHLSVQLDQAGKHIAELLDQRQPLQDDRDKLATEREQLQASLAAAAEQAASAGRDASGAASRIDGLLAANTALQQRLGQLEAEHQTQIAHERSALEQAQLEVERLRTHEATLQEQADSLQAARNLAAERAESAAAALAKLRAQAQSLDHAARQVADLQQRLADIEVAWVEVNQQLEEAEEADPQALEAAALERHRYSSELDQLSQLRDHALATLSESVAQMRDLAERPPLPLSISATSMPKPPERRWWKFSRSS